MFIHKNSKEYDVFFNKYKTNSCVHYHTDTPVKPVDQPASPDPGRVSTALRGDGTIPIAGNRNDTSTDHWPTDEASRITKFPESEPARYNLRPRR